MASKKGLEKRLEDLENYLGVEYLESHNRYFPTGGGKLQDLRDLLLEEVGDDQCLYALLEYLGLVYESGPRIVKKSPKKKK